MMLAQALGVDPRSRLVLPREQDMGLTSVLHRNAGTVADLFGELELQLFLAVGGVFLGGLHRGQLVE